MSSTPSTTDSRKDVEKQDAGQGDEEGEDVVDPWTVESKSAKGVDYDKLISKFIFICLYFHLLKF